MAKGDLIFIDIETTGLDWGTHHAIEIAWMMGDMTEPEVIIPYDYEGAGDTWTPWGNADPEAMKINKFFERYHGSVERSSTQDIVRFLQMAEGSTLVGANVRFDAHFIRKDLGLDKEPWHHRLLDIEAYAAGVFGWSNIKGMSDLKAELEKYDVEVTHDHTAAGDTKGVKIIYETLVKIANR